MSGTKITNSFDEKSKSTMYTMTKTENGKSAMLRIVNGGIVAVGDTSIFKKDEEYALLNEYQNNASAVKVNKNLPDVEYTKKDGNVEIKADKTYSLNSFAKLMGVTLQGSNANYTTPAMPQGAMPNFSNSGKTYPDLSGFDGMGTNPTAAVGGSFDSGLYNNMFQQVQQMFQFAGTMSAYGDNSFGTQAINDLVQATKNMHFYTPQVNAPTNMPVIAPTSSSPTDKTSTKEPAETVKTNSEAATSDKDSVADAKKELQTLTKTEKSKITTVKLTDGTILEKFTDVNNNRIVDHRANGKLVSRDRYDTKNNTRRSEYFDGEKAGTIIKVYTNKDGKRVAEQWHREPANKLILKKTTYFTGKQAEEKATAEYKTAANNTEVERLKRIDLKIKTLKEQFKEAQTACKNGHTERNSDFVDTKEKIKKLEAFRNSDDLKKSEANLKTLQAKHDDPKASREEIDRASYQIGEIQYMLGLLENGSSKL